MRETFNIIKEEFGIKTARVYSQMNTESYRSGPSLRASLKKIKNPPTIPEIEEALEDLVNFKYIIIKTVSPFTKAGKPVNYYKRVDQFLGI